MDKKYEYELEEHYIIYNNETGEKVIVRPDRDGLQMVEISSYGDTGEELVNLVLTARQAKLLNIAIHKVISSNALKE